ncbi:hypothetical protein [Spiroplasma endosymbiont of Tiphia femorata]|uniref:hypothetical protein n=1 Tax=Spiroplasma endosymbiont of Tiphia femorata TaxID=3066326 RepID=UPI0030D300BF
MGMTPKQNHQLIKTVWKSTGEIEKDFTQNKDLQFRVCPFTIILGAINSTETGYKPPTSIPNDFILHLVKSLLEKKQYKQFETILIILFKIKIIQMKHINNYKLVMYFMEIL